MDQTVKANPMTDTKDDVELPPMPALQNMTERVEVWGLMQDYARQAVRMERERCAKVCEALAMQALSMESGDKSEATNVMLRQIAHLGRYECAAAIRKGESRG